MSGDLDLIFRLRKHAEIHRTILIRKSIQERKPDKISDILEEAADEIDKLRDSTKGMVPEEEVYCGSCACNICYQRQKEAEGS